MPCVVSAGKPAVMVDCHGWRTIHSSRSLQMCVFCVFNESNCAVQTQGLLWLRQTVRLARCHCQKSPWQHLQARMALQRRTRLCLATLIANGCSYDPFSCQRMTASSFQAGACWRYIWVLLAFLHTRRKYLTHFISVGKKQLVWVLTFKDFQILDKCLLSTDSPCANKVPDWPA